ncbi:methyl-accepting chemotaxis protein [Treponema rectale]|uniref:Methyl-accepting chemotaxis protein n=1 Tax=Treponema rectale TaxID=744512 RepID=A0A840SEM8_9SPIR|nr:methyl-accepting chemotaxis protein [Treponema rectale]MBB5218013.1 methyl-accepting chemotaxis protein [Treponema rectale]QOS40272.1 methyl-accepting chemotaxis protein [Treponema rectale]
MKLKKYLFTKNENPERKNSRQFTIINFIVFISIFLYSNYFFDIPAEYLVPTFVWQFILSAIFLILIMPTFNNLISFTLARRINFWKNHKATPHQKELIIRKLKMYPSRKGFETSVLYHGFQIAASLIYYLFYHIDIRIITINYLLQLNIIYIGVMTTFSYAELECRKNIAAIMNELQGTRYYERVSEPVNSLMSLFFLYILLPVVFFSASTFGIVIISKTFVTIHPLTGTISTLELSLKELSGNFTFGLLPKDFSSSRMITAGIINSVIIILHVLLYIKKIAYYIFRMGKALTAISIGNITKVKLFPVDLNTEISHTMYLLNKIIMIFRDIQNKTESANNEIIESGANLNEISAETKETVAMQNMSLSEITETIQKTTEVSADVKQKLSEVINVAKKTLSNAQKNFSDFSENFSKIEEITDTNQMTITEIEQLSSKILSIHDIITMIDSLAEQTKIIAFNAELVANSLNHDNVNLHNVSEEIRQLAETTIELTGKAKEKIQEIQTSSEELIVSGESCMNKIQEGNSLSAELINHFAIIRDSASKSVKDTQTIMNSLNNQEQYFNLISSSINLTSERVNEFSETSKIIASTIEQLQKSSSDITNMSFNINKKSIDQQGENI